MRRCEPELERAPATFYDQLIAAGERVPRYGLHGGMPLHNDGERFAPCDRPFAELPNLSDLGVAGERLEATTIVLARLA